MELQEACTSVCRSRSRGPEGHLSPPMAQSRPFILSFGCLKCRQTRGAETPRPLRCKESPSLPSPSALRWPCTNRPAGESRLVTSAAFQSQEADSGARLPLSVPITRSLGGSGGTKMDTAWCWPTGRLVQERTTLKAGMGCGWAQRPGIN